MRSAAAILGPSDDGRDEASVTADELLDKAFLALADPVRRAIVARLSRGSATVNDLAEPFAITKQAVSRHIHVLEQAGLVTRSRDAQRRPVHLDAAALERLTAWIDRYRLVAEARYRALDGVLATSRSAPPTSSGGGQAVATPQKEKES
ncbi:winged helix-turn-helix transcriptional regulator [Microbacterium sp. 4R-513]|uniref:ArsR/SmtB family transcription factor n=1 Tax=Microbacterium sp. 4R-513 TaxID=2567934 RepID=UPI0013E1015E|nr:metalloregulator ArsR/SmtB family transcription factor [Microbacterium sp. 4R-513]QIG38477.1 winged helix-turn-helix transcriptional regulator [Microbacterium sp. 4R-513]